MSRTRFASSLAPKRRVRVAATASPLPAGRWQRLAQHWLAAFIEHAPPRGVGSAAAALLLLASLAYGIVRGDQTTVIAARLQNLCDSVADAAGFGITEIALTGDHYVSREKILATAGITPHSSLLFLNAAQARARLLTNPWIADAAVLKLYPGRLRIEITERKPFALWQKNDVVSLIAADGTVLEPSVPRRFLSLPLVVGAGAARKAHNFLVMVRSFPAMAQLVTAWVLVADRRWNLYLKDGVEVKLPEFAPQRALERLVDLNRAKQLLARDIVKVDLRLPGRVTVQLSDAAYAAREAALKAAAARTKKKRTGGEA